MTNATLHANGVPTGTISAPAASATSALTIDADLAAAGADVAQLQAYLAIWHAVAVSAQRDLYIWGAGRAGRHAAAAVLERGGRVTAFVETSGERAGQRIDDLPVIAAADLDARRRTGNGAPFVVITSIHAASIAQTLDRLQWPPDDRRILDVAALLPQPAVDAAVALPQPPSVTPLQNALGQSFAYPRGLGDRHLQHCRVSSSRDAMLSHLPAHAVVAEVGTQRGYFARKILRNTQPSTLHIIDIDLGLLERDALEQARGATIVHLHEGDSATTLETFPDGYFDWIYIDGDHSYEGVRRDAAVAARKITRDGLLVFNDYTPYSPLELSPYGTMHVVHELCLDDGFELLRIGLHGLGYHDVVLRRRQDHD